MNSHYTTKREAYNAGVAGLPEPTPITKHVRYRDPISWLWVEGDVETVASIERRAAWQKGRKTYECRQHVAELREAAER